MMKHGFLLAALSLIFIYSGLAQQNSRPHSSPAKAKTKNTSFSSNHQNGTKSFDITKIPITDKPLGTFPYFGLPEGYEINSHNNPMDFGHFPFWVGNHFEWVEGKIFYNNIYPKEGKTFSQYEVEKNLDNLLTSAGGVKVFHGKIPSDSAEGLEDDIKVTFVDGIGDVYSDPASVYVIRRKDKNIWVQLCISRFSGGWVIAETKPFEQTASLISADELKTQIESDGKAIIHVNFATDKADILPESEPQIEEVIKMLQQDKNLRLSINGYTDNTGTPEHNQKLSETRAQSVLKELTDKGIEKSRLQAKGFGQNNPVADNNTDEGKAQNRRVELVKM